MRSARGAAVQAQPLGHGVSEATSASAPPGPQGTGVVVGVDAFGGVLTVSVGHANPKVVNAIVEQVKKINHTSTLYANSQLSDLAEKLASIAPGNLKKSFITSSGTEANETAISAARTYTGRIPLIVLRHSYSGRSAATLAMSWS